MACADDVVILSGTTANWALALAQAIADRLETKLGAGVIEHFPDGETSVRVGVSVCGRQVFLTLVGQVGASSGRERATWARSAASSGGEDVGAALNQRVQ